MQYIDNRVFTFDINYPLNTKVRRYWTHDTPDAEYLAESGFYFTPTKKNGDQITCFSCKKRETNIEGITNILDHHLINSPSCPLSLIYSHKINYMSLNESEKKSYWERQLLFSDPLSPKSIALRKDTFGKFWKFDKSRLKSSLTSTKLAESGFFFCPQNEQVDDRVECVYCSITLQSWEINDDPIAEHRNNSSGFCYFLHKCDDNYDPKVSNKDMNLSILSEKDPDFLSTDENEIITNARARREKLIKRSDKSMEIEDLMSDYESLSDNYQLLKSDSSDIDIFPQSRRNQNKLRLSSSTHHRKKSASPSISEPIEVIMDEESENDYTGNGFVLGEAGETKDDDEPVLLESIEDFEPEENSKTRKRSINSIRKPTKKPKGTPQSNSSRAKSNNDTSIGSTKLVEEVHDNELGMGLSSPAPKLRRSRRLRQPSSNDNSFIFSLPKTKDELSAFREMHLSHDDDNEENEPSASADGILDDMGDGKKDESVILDRGQSNYGEGETSRVNKEDEGPNFTTQPSGEENVNVESEEDSAEESDEENAEESDEENIGESDEESVEEESLNEMEESVADVNESIYESTQAYSSQDPIEDTDDSEYEPVKITTKAKLRPVNKAKIQVKPKNILFDDNVAFNPPKKGKIKLGFVKTQSPVSIMDISNQDIGDYGDNNLDFIEKNVHKTNPSPVKNFNTKKGKSKVFKIDTTDEIEVKPKPESILEEAQPIQIENGTSPVKLAMPSDVSASTDINIKVKSPASKDPTVEKPDMISSPVSTQRYDEDIRKIMEINKQLEKSMLELSDSESEKEDEEKNAETEEPTKLNSNILESFDGEFNPEAHGTFTSPSKSIADEEIDNLEGTGSNSPIIGSTRLEHDISRSKSITRSDEETEKSNKPVSSIQDDIIEDIKSIGISTDKVEMVQEKLNTMEQTRQYLERISSLDYSLKDDIEGELTQFIAAMPEDEEELTIKQWIEHCGHNCSKLVREICDDLISSFEQESQKGLKYLQSLPTSD